MAVVAMASAFPYPYPQAPGPALAYPKAGPNGHYDAKHYFQYTNVAAPDVFEWGYRRGNDPQHFREEYLSQKAHNFKAKLRWGDAYEVIMEDQNGCELNAVHFFLIFFSLSQIIYNSIDNRVSYKCYDSNSQLF